jgi:hypothetical protein
LRELLKSIKMPPKQKRAQSKTADKVEKNETPQKQSARKANKS